MHMADALLSPVVGGTMWGASMGALAWCARKLRDRLEGPLVPYMGVLGAFVFAAQMVNFTIPGTGSSGHLGGGLLLAILLGPYAAFLVMASVLFVQALFFADGGLLALGCNVWNLGVYPCLVAYPLIYRPLAAGKPTRRRIGVAATLAAVVGLQLGALSVVLQTVQSGVSELPFKSFLFFMQPVHLGIGVVEGLVTAAVVASIGTLDPAILSLADDVRPKSSLRKPLAVLAVLTLLVGGGLSWFASARPDGLEWSIEKVTGAPEIERRASPVRAASARIQEKTAILRDVGIPSRSDSDETGDVGASTRAGEAAGTSISGVLGGVIVMTLVVVFGIGLRLLQRRKFMVED